MNIYVGNLDSKVSEQDLRDAFSAHGEVSSASLITDKFTGQSRGFGFVEMPNQEEANRAIAALNGSELKGRNLKVNEAKPRQDRPKGKAFGGGVKGRGRFGGGTNRW